MTCKEKLKLEHPDWSEEKFRFIFRHECPSGYDIIYDPDCREYDCVNCWDREIPETKNVENNEEIKEMENKTTKKTKAELLTEIAALKKEVENLDKYRQYEQVADELAAMRDALMNKGFTREEAIQFIFNAMNSMVK